MDRRHRTQMVSIYNRGSSYNCDIIVFLVELDGAEVDGQQPIDAAGQ